MSVRKKTVVSQRNNPAIKPRAGAAEQPASRDQDFNLWLLQRAAALRGGHFSSFNWDDVAEELEAMAKSDERALTSHLKNLLEHLLKWQFLPSLRSPSWQATIKNARDAVSDLLRDSPSLRPELDRFIQTAYARAQRDCGDDIKGRSQDSSAVPAVCPWPFDTFASADFWPDGADGHGQSGLV
jgi:hypothetical protein